MTYKGFVNAESVKNLTKPAVAKLVETGKGKRKSVKSSQVVQNQGITVLSMYRVILRLSVRKRAFSGEIDYVRKMERLVATLKNIKTNNQNK